MTISKCVLAITAVFEGGGGGPVTFGLCAPKDIRTLKTWLNKLANALKRLAEKWC